MNTYLLLEFCINTLFANKSLCENINGSFSNGFIAYLKKLISSDDIHLSNYLRSYCYRSVKISFDIFYRQIFINYYPLSKNTDCTSDFRSIDAGSLIEWNFCNV